VSRRRTARPLPDGALVALFRGAVPRVPRSRPPVVDLAEYRAASAAARSLRAALGHPPWLARVGVAFSRPAGLEVRAFVHRDPLGADAARVPAFLHGVRVRLTRA
jgi:hypothetical protein